MVKEIALPSVMSLRLEMWWQDQLLATGTGFIVETDDAAFLITNRHNLAGLKTNGETLSSHGVTPDKVRILHNDRERLGKWIWKEEWLVDGDDQPLWLEHPSGSKQVDVVALKLSDLENVQLYPYSLSMADPPVIEAATDLSIIGFPYSEASHGGMGIWARGTVASEPSLDYGDWPSFLIDSRTRPGQSGSPVIYFSSNGSIKRASGTVVMKLGHVVYLLGVYSGRINESSDIGIVWKASVIQDLVTMPSVASN
ncbi:serine protease [Arthrobacter sp. G119Y2]|uniref:serine protease n=1 Tax=Arthrobacter sp. G119Y2 TaxID=3134965 RepID=UPI00311A6682